MNAIKIIWATNARECPRIQKQARERQQLKKANTEDTGGCNQKPKSTTETRRRSKPIFTREDTEGHGGELETKSLPQRAQRRIKAIKFAQKTKKFAISNFAISNTKARRKPKPFGPEYTRINTNKTGKRNQKLF